MSQLTLVSYLDEYLLYIEDRLDRPIFQTTTYNNYLKKNNNNFKESS